MDSRRNDWAVHGRKAVRGGGPMDVEMKMDPRRVEPSKVQTQNNLITLSIRDLGGKIND